MLPESKSPTGFPTDSINDWVFDLDNTIYPVRSNLFVRVAVRITEFVARHFDVPHDEAKVIQKDLFHRYGTTMRGLMVEQGLTPEEYLHFVHDIDVSDLPGRSLTSISCTKCRYSCLLYTSPSPRDGLLSRMPSSA